MLQQSSAYVIVYLCLISYVKALEKFSVKVERVVKLSAKEYRCGNAVVAGRF